MTLYRIIDPATKKPVSNDSTDRASIARVLASMRAYQPEAGYVIRTIQK